MDARADEAAARLIAVRRWPDGVRCPYCGHADAARRRPRPERRWPQWRCRRCRRDFTAITATESAGSRRSPAELADAVRAGADQDDAPRSVAAGLPPSERKMISALRRRPLGATTSKLSEITAVSATQTRRALRSLQRRGWTERRAGVVNDGHRLAPASLWSLTYSPSCIDAFRWLPPRSAPKPPLPVPDAVPPEFWHLFWSGTSGPELSVSVDALHIAGTAIGSNDLAAEAWALKTLPSDTLQALGQMRGYEAGDTAALIACEIERRRAAHA